MSENKVRPTRSWLESTIDKDFSVIIHDIVMNRFKNKWRLPGKRSRSSIDQEDQSGSQDINIADDLTTLKTAAPISHKFTSICDAIDEKLLMDSTFYDGNCFYGEESPIDDVSASRTTTISDEISEKDELIFGSISDLKQTESKLKNADEDLGTLDAVNGYVKFLNGKRIKVISCGGIDDDDDQHLYDSLEDIRHISQNITLTSEDLGFKPPLKGDYPESPEEDTSITSEDISDLLSGSSFNSSIAPTDLQYQHNVEPEDYFEEDKHGISVEESLKLLSNEELRIIFNTNLKDNLEDNLQYEETINDIYRQDSKIQELGIMFSMGKRAKGYIGSIPHIAAAKNMLIANVTKSALTASLAKKYFFPPSTRTDCPQGKLVIDNINLDTNHIKEHGRQPPCYYMVTVQHDTLVLHTDITPPNCFGEVSFKDQLIFDKVDHDFTLRMSLYKLQCKSSSPGSRKLWPRKRHLHVPQLKLIGEREITIKNMRTSMYSFGEEILSVNVSSFVHTGRSVLRAPVHVGKVLRKNSRQTKMANQYRWGILDGTDLKLYENVVEARSAVPVQVLRLTQCQSCKPYYFTANTLVVDYVESNTSCQIYLKFDSSNKYREWLCGLNFAILISKKWDY